MADRNSLDVDKKRVSPSTILKKSFIRSNISKSPHLRHIRELEDLGGILESVSNSSGSTGRSSEENENDNQTNMPIIKARTKLDRSAHKKPKISYTNVSRNHKPLARLKQQQKLTISYGSKTEKINQPIKDPDPYYWDEETFLVLNKKREIYRFNKSKSLFLFEQYSSVRMAAIRFYIHPYFSNMVFMTILCNLIVMISQATSDPGSGSYEYSAGGNYNRSRNIFTILSSILKLQANYEDIEICLEYLFTFIFTIEMVTKVIARGFVLHSFAYLRSGWDLLDFAIIIIAYMLIGLEVLGLGWGCGYFWLKKSGSF